MSWKARITERLAEWLGFIGWFILFLNVLMFGLASVWFCYQLLSHLINLCRRTIFHTDW